MKETVLSNITVTFCVLAAHAALSALIAGGDQASPGLAHVVIAACIAIAAGGASSKRTAARMDPHRRALSVACAASGLALFTEVGLLAAPSRLGVASPDALPQAWPMGNAAVVIGVLGYVIWRVTKPAGLDLPPGSRRYVAMMYATSAYATYVAVLSGHALLSLACIPIATVGVLMQWGAQSAFASVHAALIRLKR